MNIGIIGATGNIGQRLVVESLSRGHRVTAFTRDPANFRDGNENVVWKTTDVFDVKSLISGLRGLDFLVSLYQPGNASKDFNDTVEKSIQDPTVYATVARNLLKAMESYPRLRLLVVGGAGSLEISPGVTRADADDQLRESLKLLGLPEDYAVAVRGHRDALNVYRLSNRLWTYVSPAEQIGPGQRTARFRLGGDQPVLDANGHSRISFEDLAVAIVDEAELPKHVQRRFTLGY